MPRKPITWIGSIIALGTGIFCSLALLKYRSAFTTADIQYNLSTVGVFLAPVLAGVAIFLWYYFNERH